MLQFNAYLERKPTDFKNPVCQVEKVIELPEREFQDLVARPCVDRDFIQENRELMGQWDGAYHCLLALSDSGNDGILMEAEGAGYVRYGAYVSHAREYIERELEQIADRLLAEITPEPESGDVCIYLEDIEECTGAEVRDDSEIARMFFRILQTRPSVAEVDAIGDCMVVTPSSGPAQDSATPLKLGDLLLLGGMENVYLVHDTADIGFVPASYAALLTDQGREEHAALLDGSVKEIRSGAYGPEIVLTGIDPELLVRFDQAAAGYAQGESMRGPSL